MVFAAILLNVVYVGNSDELVRAAAAAKPGTSILLRPGVYRGGVFLSDLHGTDDQWIEIAGSDPQKPPRIEGGGSGLQLSRVSYLRLRNLTISGCRDNGLNVDDGGQYTRPSHHVAISGIQVRDLPPGNHDGIKLSGIDNFTVKDCNVERWGGSAIDMVGCHKAQITNCMFRAGGDSGVQCKGGTAEIALERCKFVDAGERSVNVGGSTGREFFRPPLATIPSGKRYEARNITVRGCTFTGSVSPIAFVGVNGANILRNTFLNPGKWVIRILQETNGSDFLPCRNGRFEKNLVVFKSNQWSAGGVNVGGGTAPETFLFRGNHWFCADDPAQSEPKLPTPEVGGQYGRDPKLRPDFTVAPDSSSRSVGAHAEIPEG